MEWSIWEVYVSPNWSDAVVGDRTQKRVCPAKKGIFHPPWKILQCLIFKIIKGAIKNEGNCNQQQRAYIP